MTSPNRSWRGVGLHHVDGVIGVEERRESPVGNQVVDTAVADNLGSVGRGLLQAGVVGQVSMEDVDIGTATHLCRHLLLGRSLVADQTDDEVVRVLRDLPDELELRWFKQKVMRNTARDRLTPIPFDAPVMTYTDMLSDFNLDLTWISRRSWCWCLTSMVWMNWCRMQCPTTLDCRGSTGLYPIVLEVLDNTIE